jgi:hypothetical protein
MSESSKLPWLKQRLKAMRLSELFQRESPAPVVQEVESFSQKLQRITLGTEHTESPQLPDRQQCPPALKDRLGKDAERLLQGEWLLFGWKEVSTGAPPCWHRDALCGVIVEPDGSSLELAHLSLPDGADARVIWELNRWSEMTRVAMHAWVNQDTGSARSAQLWLEDWCERNPAGYGINWTSPLEVALRLINFSWFDALIHGMENAQLSLQQQRLAERIIPAHALWVHDYRSTSAGATHTTLGEAVGLLHVVKRWPQLTETLGSAKELWEEITVLIHQMFAADGGSKEQSLYYHLFSWELAWLATRLMNVQDTTELRRLRYAAEFFVRMVHPLEPWDYGDSDDSQVLPLVLNRGDALSEWQSWMADHTHGNAIGYWLGHSPVSAEHITRALQKPGWWLAPDSGMAVLEIDRWMLRLDASPLGYGSQAAHGHCDALHLSIWDSASALIIDPGTACYYSMPMRRHQLTSWDLHNGPRPLQGYQMPLREQPFSWTAHHPTPAAEIVEPRKLAASLQHEGQHYTRTVEIRKDGFLSILDESITQDAFIVTWTFAPECRVHPWSDDSIIVERGSERWRLSVQSTSLTQVEFHALMVSRQYGRLEQTNALSLTAHSSMTTVWSRL